MFWRRKASSGRDFLAAQFPLFERALDRRSQAQNAILQQIVGSALLHVLDHLVLAEGSGEHDEGNHQAGLVQDLQCAQVVEARERMIGQDDIRHFAEPLGVIRFGLHPFAEGAKSETSQFVCDQFKIGEVVFEYQSKKLSRHCKTSLRLPYRRARPNFRHVGIFRAMLRFSLVSHF